MLRYSIQAIIWNVSIDFYRLTRIMSKQRLGIYFFLYCITAVPAEVILATRPYEPPKYMLQILNISSLLCFVVVILLTVKNSNISKTTPDS